jgi:hypothetical protein
MEKLKNINSRLLSNLCEQDFAGYDIFDGLNSPILKRFGLYRFSYIRLAWIQFFKRSPINLRRLVGISKQRNSKGVALVILGLLEDFERTHEPLMLKKAVELGTWLLDNRCNPTQWKYSCWGYHFPWEARAFHVPVGKPNIITTCYVARSLWALSTYSIDKKFELAANDAGRFIVDVLYTENDNRKFFAYIPGENAFVHNASLWGAAVVAETARRLSDKRMADIALTVCMQSVKEQQPDGAWVYGGRGHHKFIDGFHTGYNLEALNMAKESLSVKDFDNAINQGMQYYRDNFFLGDGTPKYYNNSTYPIDMHLVSQAILTFVKVGGTQDDKMMATKVIEWAIDNMYIESTGYFRCQITKWYKNNICYLRWTQAWAYYSIAIYLNHHIDEKK